MAREINLPEWDGPIVTPDGKQSWIKRIGDTQLIIEYFRDRVTDEVVTQGIFSQGCLGGRHWLIRDNRRFDMGPSKTSWGELQLIPTTYGPGEVIEEDVSTPEKMADFLEKLPRFI